MIFLKQRTPLGIPTSFIDCNGRSIDEFVRLLQAMQTSDKNQVATPEGWVPGQDVIVPPPKTAEAVAKRASEGYKMVDWYCSTKSLRPADSGP